MGLTRMLADAVGLATQWLYDGSLVARCDCQQHWV